MKKKNGVIGTIIFHLLIILLIVFLGFSTPLPLPEEEGILINFGTDDFGSGNIEPRLATSEQPGEIPRESSEASTDEEEISTQDFEEAPAVKEEIKTTEKKPEEKKVITDNKPDNKVEEKKEEVVEEKKVNERALYKGRNTEDKTSQSEGITEGNGNQGSVTGSTESDNYSSGLSSGSGGVEFSLTGRNPVSLPKPKYEYQLEGKVVVEIKVDREGKVTEARAGVPGSNTNEPKLLAAAREAAMKARFESKPDAPFTQKGTITYYFILQ